MAKRETQIVSVFCKWLGRAARELAAENKLAIIEASDFPKGSPIHEDGSTEYDPMKPLVLFAVYLRSPSEIRRWNGVRRARDAFMRAA
jgi:hypothetical protein